MTTLIAKITGTINELLLRERQKFSGLRKVGTLHGSYSGKGPACAATVLIFDWGNTTSLNPVDLLGKIGKILLRDPTMIVV